MRSLGEHFASFLRKVSISEDSAPGVDVPADERQDRSQWGNMLRQEARTNAGNTGCRGSREEPCRSASKRKTKTMSQLRWCVVTGGGLVWLAWRACTALHLWTIACSKRSTKPLLGRHASSHGGRGLRLSAKFPAGSHHVGLHWLHVNSCICGFEADAGVSGYLKGVLVHAVYVTYYYLLAGQTSNIKHRVLKPSLDGRRMGAESSGAAVHSRGHEDWFSVQNESQNGRGKVTSTPNTYKNQLWPKANAG